jgi:hypothetical protein
MKRILLLSALFITILVSAQVPQGISYQAIALNGSGNPVVSSNVGIRISVLDNTATGTVLYTETQTKTTNAQGLFNLVIGQGTPTSGTFSAINWRVNSKFLKVEMDAAGGTNYVLIGTTQLLSAPYALAADSLVTSAGEGITLVSPNGTPYQLTVSDTGQLSLPTSGSTTNLPTNFYMYGTFNSFNASTALLMGTMNGGGSLNKLGYKYLTSGTQIKFVTENNTNAAVYGIDGTLQVVQNGGVYTIPSTGFYCIRLTSYNNGNNTYGNYNLNATSISPSLIAGSSTVVNPTYNSTSNTFSFIINGVTSTNNNQFYFTLPAAQVGNDTYGDNLADGTIEYGGSSISFPNTTSTPKNYKVDLIINFNGSGTYTIIQL